MTNFGLTSGLRRLHLYGAILFGAWFFLVRAQAPVLAYTCNYNLECESDEENDETCQSCPSDCYEQCTCGDNVCDFPAEGGGYWGCGDTEHPENCTYCPEDCGECFECYPSVCDDDGYCESCDWWSDGDEKCDSLGGYGVQWCGSDGECHDSCSDDYDCHWGGGEWCGQDWECHDDCWDDSDCPLYNTCDIWSGDCTPIVT